MHPLLMDVNDGRMASRFASEPDDGTPLKMHTDEASAGDLPARERTAANPAGMRPATSLSKERLSRHGPHKHLRVPDGETEVVGKIDKARDRYPYSIVWTPLPLITWIIPFIGHMGICDSEGRVYDFAGPYTISEDNMAFSSPTRYLKLDPKKAKLMKWNEALDVGNMVYEKRMHNLCCDNCHSHVARCLDEMGYAGYTNWNMVILCFWVLVAGRWVSFGKMLQSWAPSLIIIGIILAVKFSGSDSV